MARGLADGVLHPRWMSEANRGFGSAALMNYPPLGGYLVGAISLLTGDLVSAFHFVLLLMTALSGAAFYVCARSFAPPLVSALASILYLLAPYRMIDLHARFAFAEVLAFLWLPLIVKFLLDLRERPSLASWTGLVAASTGLALTHVLTAFMVLVVVGPVVAWIVLRDRQWKGMVGLALAAVATFALAAAYLLPLLVERGLTYTEFLTDAGWGEWRTNFLFLQPTDPGAVTLPIRPLVEMSFWYAVGLIIVSAAFAIRVKGRGTGMLLAASAIAIGLQLSISAVIWRLIPGMDLLQFPWRFQSLLVLLSCLLAATAAAKIRWSSGSLIGVAVAGAVFFALFLWRGIAYDVTATSLEQAEIAGLVYKEHMPRGVEEWRLFERLPLDGAPLVATSSPAQVEVQEWSSHRREMGVTTGEPTQVALRTFYYPGWSASLDGQPAAIEVLSPLHTLAVSVPSGAHHLEVRFGPSPIRVVGSILSLLTAGLLILANLRYRRTSS